MAQPYAFRIGTLRNFASVQYGDGPLVEYERMVGRGQIKADPHQVRTVKHMQRLYNELMADPSFR